MPDVTVTIDGVTVSVPAGTNVVDAARKAGSAIPVFCYHPKMKPVGMCRMCLVEVYTPSIDRATGKPVIGEDGKPVLALMMNKLQTGCTTPVSDGMVVNTVSDKVKFAQNGVLEFLLTSHPLDCPVCDKGGECPLQNLTMQWGPAKSRFDYNDKVHFEKPIPLGDLIYLDRERCILCSRCVRFQDEIVDDPVLGFNNRGRSWEIISKSTPAFDSKFSGNTTDICPVGALTSADFRFKARVWELRSVPSVCNHCSVGCNVSLDMRYDDLMRVMPRENDYVNEIWICDKGRYGMRYFAQEDRLTQPLIRRNGQLQPATWEEAYGLIGEKVAAIRNSAGGAALGGIAGPKLPNEDLFVFRKLMRDVFGTGNIDHRNGRADDGELDDSVRSLGVGKGTNLMTLGKGTAVLVIGADPEEEAPLYVPRLRGIVSRGGTLAVVNSYATKLDRSATTSIRTKPGSEAHLVLALVAALVQGGHTNTSFLGNGRVRGHEEIKPAINNYLAAYPGSTLAERTGVTPEAVAALAKTFAEAENGIIIYGRAAQQAGPAMTQAFGNILTLTGKVGRANNGLIALLPAGNSRGALDMGVRPDTTTNGASARRMLELANEGTLRAMYIAAANPAADNPLAAQALDKLEFLVVQDLFLTATAELADVVLPAAAPAERDGTYTNAERRVQRFRQARQAPNDVPTDWESFQRVAQSVLAIIPAAKAAQPVGGRKGRVSSANAVAVAEGPGWEYVVSSDIADDISRTVPGYGKTSYTSLELTRKSWGRQPNEAVYYDGTSYENSEGLGEQIATTAEDNKSQLPVTWREPELTNEPDGFPMTLLAPVRAYDNGEWSRGSKLLPRQVPPHAILSVADAERLGVNIGDTVEIQSPAGAVVLRAQIDAKQAAGLVLVPAVRGASLGALLSGTTTNVQVRKAE